MNMEKTYDPKAIEQQLYRRWEGDGAFIAHVDKDKKPFTIMMPPPNITGQLHMGHAIDCVLQDIPTRYHRMKGHATLWLPGTDHASIATEVKIVEQLATEGLTKEDLGREGFLERAWRWKEEYGGRITSQLRRLGASCDWSRERFTMDEGCSRAVREVFVRLYEKGLIYQGNKIINWCPVCLTALSDAEVEFEDQDSHLWHIRYDSKDGKHSVVVATTRPETMLGDTGVAVNPDDERYKDLIGKTLILPLMNREIPVVADDYVDKDFGTGAVKMTPAHDPNDFEVGQRHSLEIVRVMNDDATMNEEAGQYAGLTREEAREAVVRDLEKTGHLVKIEEYKHSVGTCYRCHTIIEPLLSEQWFIDMKPLAKPAIEAVRSGETKFLPERFSKIYYNWMENIRDWCISRQLWWGHRIPAWYCDDCGETIVTREDPTHCPKCGGANLSQDEDVLDTWFSSALWPFSTLGWPDKTEDLAYFYPTNMLVTGYDIIFFWVARMIFSGIEQMGQVPFDTVLIHGLVRDEKGRKMSKSLGNGIDPLEVIEQYGADALRFSLVQGISPGNDTRYLPEKVEAARNFANKIWNASRFVLMNTDSFESLEGKKLALPDQWILTRYQKAVKEITQHIDDADFGLAAQAIYDFAWSEFCDWYIELAKGRLLGEDEEQKKTVKAVLLHVLEGIVKLLHPFMPFLTESIYQNLPQKEGFIMLSNWPEYNEKYLLTKEAEQMEGIMEAIRNIRNLRSEMNVPAGKKARVMLVPAQGWKEVLEESELYFKRLASASSVEVIEDKNLITEKIAATVCQAAEILIPLGDLVEFDKEIARLEKEKEALLKEIKRGQGMLKNEGFVSKAPPQLIEKEKEKLEANLLMEEKLEKHIKQMQDMM